MLALEVVPYHTKLVEKKNDFTPTVRQRRGVGNGSNTCVPSIARRLLYNVCLRPLLYARLAFPHLSPPAHLPTFSLAPRFARRPQLALVASGASMILRNPLLGWLGLYLALTGYLNQSPREAEGAGASAFSTVILPASTLMTQYFPLFFPRRA